MNELAPSWAFDYDAHSEHDRLRHAAAMLVVAAERLSP